MVRTNKRGSARDRVLDAAVECFATRGYAATTIADIEVAAGLKPRCGGTYRHFKSKKEMLEAAVESMLEDSDLLLGDGVESLEAAAADGLALLDRNRQVRRLLFRDLDEFPELKAKVAEQLVERSYRLAADTASAYRPDADTEAMAAVMVGALFSFRVVESLIGRTPLGVSDDRFIAAWSTAFEGLLSGAEPVDDAHAS